MTHEEWQQQIVDLARAYGWRHLHVRKSVGTRRGSGRGWMTTTNVKGWPDLLLWHVADRRRVAIEVKVPPDKPTPEQRDLLDQLVRSGMVERAMVAYPDDLDEVNRLLRRPHR